MDAAPNGPERELGGKRAAKNPFMDTPEPDDHNLIDLTGEQPAVVNAQSHTTMELPGDDIKPENSPSARLLDVPGHEVPSDDHTPRDEPVLPSIKEEGENMVTVPPSTPLRGMGSTRDTAINLDDDSEDGGLFVRDVQELSDPFKATPSTAVKKDNDNDDIFMFGTATSTLKLAPKSQERPKFKKHSLDDSDSMDDTHCPESKNSAPKKLNVSGKGRAAIRASGVRAKTAREWHERDHKRRESAILKKRLVLERKPIGPLKRQKTENGRIIDRMQERTELIRMETQRTIGNLLYSHPMQARMGQAPVPDGHVDDDSTTTRSKKSFGEQALSEASCDPATAKKDMKMLNDASRTFGLNNCVPCGSDKWKLKGIKQPLYHHQMLGVQWMLSKEMGLDKGGVNADEMGLGKTIQALATIVSNPPEQKDKDEGRLATLIVVPSSVVRQWMTEIELFVEEDKVRNIQVFKASGEGSLRSLRNSDIIITTYHEVLRGYPDAKVQEEMKSGITTEERKQELIDQHYGTLFKMRFWRVILDEAHAIKNPCSQTSIACRSLNATYRWGLTGTPMHNSLKEAWPYLSFLKLKWAQTRQDFNKLVGNLDNARNANQFNKIIAAIVQRRTSEFRIFGKPPFIVPLCFVEQRIVPLTEEEKIIYRTVESRYRAILRRMYNKLRKGGMLPSAGQEITNPSGGKGKTQSKGRHDPTKPKSRNLDIYLVFLVRLRQGTVHPYLLEPVINKTLIPEDIERIQNGLAKLKGKSSIGDMLKSLPPTTTPFDLDQELEVALADKELTICCFCDNEASNPQTAECSHVLCDSCIDGQILMASESNMSIARCPECDKPVTGLRPIESVLPEDEDDSDTESIASLATTYNNAAHNDKATTPYDDDDMSEYKRWKELKKSASAASSLQRGPARGLDGKKLGNDFYNMQPRLGPKKSKWLITADKKHPQPLPPSSKIDAIVEAVVSWQKEAPEDKIIVFTQFMIENQILGRLLQSKGIPFAYYYGDLSSKDKHRVVEGFKEDPKLKVMISSLQAGGVGLNLTCANRVILSDPWWNAAIEMQAFCRVFRIGQKKKTHFLTILTENTIDMRMNSLSKTKLNNIENALSCTKALTVEDCLTLFGRVTEDENGDMLIEEDYVD